MKTIRERDRQLSRKIAKLIEERGLNPNAVSKLAGIDNANFYRLLKNERSWRFDHLEKTCRALQISFRDLFGQPLRVPLVAKVSALEPFPYPGEITEDVEHMECQGMSGEENMRLYAIEVGDRSFLPAFGVGTRFVAEKESFGSIVDGSLVVCPDDSGGAQIFRLHLSKDQITLRSLNPSVDDRILPKSHLKLCDRVVMIYPV